ncbi:hypothetical protein [Archangium violaceum]|uniref:hypothetical protein n=1 Tax=Archangium violaceum TaxID=83451 RepID=UPI0036DEB5C6
MTRASSGRLHALTGFRGLAWPWWLTVLRHQPSARGRAGDARTKEHQRHQGQRPYSRGPPLTREGLMMN